MREYDMRGANYVSVDGRLQIGRRRLRCRLHHSAAIRRTPHTIVVVTSVRFSLLS
jgi:hypothetical protein